jgi:hypothetical protein
MVTVENLNPVADLRFGQLSIYAQDEWNVNKQLEIDLRCSW